MSDCFGEKVLTRASFHRAAPNTAGGRPIRLAVTAAGATTSGAESQSCDDRPAPGQRRPGHGAGRLGRRRPRGADRPVARPDRGDGPHRAGRGLRGPLGRRARSASPAASTGPGWRYEVLDVAGPQPARRPGLPTASPAPPPRPPAAIPRRAANAYPHGYEQVVQFFEAPMAPDLCVVHSAAHNYEDRGGHRGEHGSLDVVQARAPFVLAGRGVRADGMVDRSCRLVDVAPTLAQLLGPAPPARAGPQRPAPGRRLPGPPGRRARCPTCSIPGAAAPPRRRLPARRVQPQHALPAGRVGPGAQRRPPDGHGHGLPPRRHGRHADGDPGQPHVAHHRRAPRPPPHPPQRLVGPALRRGRDHQLARHLADRHDSGWRRASRRSSRPSGPPSRPPSPPPSTSRPTGAPTFSTFDFFRRGDIPPFPQARRTCPT